MKLKENMLGLVAIVIALVALGMVYTSGPKALGGTTNYDAVDVADGYYVDATQIIDGSGSFVGAFAGTTFSSTGTTTAATTAGRFSVASSSPSYAGDVIIDGAATTTLLMGSSAANRGSCFQLENSLGVATRAYIGSAGNAFIVEAGVCK